MKHQSKNAASEILSPQSASLILFESQVFDTLQGKIFCMAGIFEDIFLLWE
jgi:hypothetical protein